jgi:hypothetical protein
MAPTAVGCSPPVACTRLLEFDPRSGHDDTDPGLNERLAE